jgi:RNA polymerase sigma-70 factor (ECF subfamily)
MELKELLKQCGQKSLAAQKCLYDRFSVPMFLLCRRYVKEDETAEEMVMNGFLKFFQSLDHFRYINDAATVGMLRRIMINECLMQLRSHNSFLLVASDEIPETGHADDFLDRISAEEIFRVITLLPVGYRTVFNLFVVEEMSHREIAGLLGISEGTSKSQLSKAKSLLQQMLIQKNDDHAYRKTK